MLALTTSEAYSKLAIELPETVTGKRTSVLPWQLMTISVNRIEEYLGTVTEEQMHQVEAGLRLVWGL